MGDLTDLAIKAKKEDGNSGALEHISDSPQLPDERKLLRELSAKIRFSGPITVAEYMREVAINPIHGFYISREALGKHGHFVTSPELSQMFGECVAVWLLHEWMKMGEPADFQLVELGPGKGTLLTDILRTLSKLQPGLVQGISLPQDEERAGAGAWHQGWVEQVGSLCALARPHCR